jgi:hypothetical protein
LPTPASPRTTTARPRPDRKFSSSPSSAARSASRFNSTGFGSGRVRMPLSAHVQHQPADTARRRPTITSQLTGQQTCQDECSQLVPMAEYDGPDKSAVNQPNRMTADHPAVAEPDAREPKRAYTPGISAKIVPGGGHSVTSGRRALAVGVALGRVSCCHEAAILMLAAKQAAGHGRRCANHPDLLTANHPVQDEPTKQMRKGWRCARRGPIREKGTTDMAILPSILARDLSAVPPVRGDDR